MKNIPLSKPDISAKEIAAVNRVLKSDRLSIGPCVDQFESLIARRAGRKYGVAVSSGTAGLHLCVRSLDLGEGDEVITTPFSFIATTNCLLYERAKPVFVDIDENSYNIDPAAMQAAVTRKTAAILPVEVFGNTAHFDRYEKIARKNSLAMIEDCCEALGGVAKSGKRTGQFGQCGVFAFYPNKQITTGEGGLIVTDDEKIRDLCRSMRNQGRDTSHWLVHNRLGYNYRLDEMSAAMGVQQVKKLDRLLAMRRRAAAMYNAALAEINGVILPPMDNPTKASWFVYVIRLADDMKPADRDAVIERLRADGIGCNIYFPAIHLQPFVMKTLKTRKGQFPVTEKVADRTIALPFFGDLKESQVAAVARSLKKAIASLRKK